MVNQPAAILPEEQRVWDALEAVKDPEIPVLSLVDLGVITKVHVHENKVEVNMTPTFSGCPAMDAMKNMVLIKLNELGFDSPVVNITFDRPWHSNLISEKGKVALKKFGLAPPPVTHGLVDLDILEHVVCPYCDSDNTEMKSPFGPTLCRSLHYCDNCRQAFEQFKPL